MRWRRRTAGTWRTSRGWRRSSSKRRLPFVFTDGANGLMSREEMLAHVATHGGYHRGAVGRIMAQADVPPPRDIFTVYLHRAEPGRRPAR